MKDAYYFSHDSNARNDEKILMLRAEHGWAGYGIYWILIEMMFENADTCLSHNKIKGIAVSYNIDITVLESVINTCISEGLFVSDGANFWSESLRRRKNKYHELKIKRSNAGKKGMAKRWGSDINDITEPEYSNNTVITKDNKVKESKVKESKIYSQNSIEFRLSNYLFELIKKKNPNHKEPNLQSWAADMNKLLRIDKRPADEVKKVIEYAQANSFWQSNILSVRKLREKYDQLNIKRLEPTKKPQQKNFKPNETQPPTGNNYEIYDPFKEGR